MFTANKIAQVSALTMDVSFSRNSNWFIYNDLIYLLIQTSKKRFAVYLFLKNWNIAFSEYIYRIFSHQATKTQEVT